MNTDVLKPRDWVCIVLALAPTVILNPYSHTLWQELPATLLQVILLGLSAAAWYGFFALRERRPVWADISAFYAIWLFDLIQGSSFNLSWVALKGLVMLFFLFMPFIVRLRLIIAIPMVTSALLPPAIAAMVDRGMAPSAYSSALPIPVLFTWWLVGMRWRIGNGSYRSYAWVGLAAYVMMLLQLSEHHIGQHTPQAVALGSGAIICAAPLLFFLLRPRGGWQLPWPFYLATCLLLGVHAFANELPFQPLCMLTAAYGALLCYISVRKKNDHMLLYGAAAIGVAANSIAHFYLSTHTELADPRILLLSAGAGVAVSMCLYFQVAAKFLPKNQPEEEAPTPFPSSKRRNILLGILIGLQLATVGGLILHHQYQQLTAPRIRMDADWLGDDSGISSFRGSPLLFVGDVRPLQDEPFFGKSLWWQQTGTSRPYPNDVINPREVTIISTPVIAYLREGEDGLWSISRVEAELSSEDEPRPGELRIKALLEIAPENDGAAGQCTAICTLPLDKEILRAMHQAIPQKDVDYPFAEAAFTVEFIAPAADSLKISEIYMNGLPLKKALRQAPRPDYGKN